MFNRITPRYDLLNRLLSAGQDIRWRKRAVRLLGDLKGGTVLDLCCGSGDFIRLFRKKYGDGIQIYGVDFAEKMLLEANQQITIKSSDQIILCQADALSLPFSDGTVDAVTIGFGIRNIVDRLAALKEITRVLKPGGELAIIEPAFPKNFLIRWPYKFYFKFIMPLIGGIISGDYEAYKYLNDSAEAFPEPEQFVKLMREAGFHDAKALPQTFGTAMIYWGRKDKLLE